MSRLLRIAAREYVAFVRTFGFWLSLCLMPLGLMVAIYASGAAARSAVTPTLAIVDLTGGGYGRALTEAAARPGPPAGRPTAIIVPTPGGPFTDAADAAARIRPYLVGEVRTPHGDRLDAVAIVHGPVDAPALDLWTRNINEPGLQARLSDALADAVRNTRLAAAGLTPAQIKALAGAEPAVTQYSPKSQAGRVSLRDRLPAVVGVAMGVVLWSLILTGAGILLNSVIEEKQNRILEVLLTSASPQEIMGGKILGAAAVTATALAVWLAVAASLIGYRSPEMLGEVVGILLSRGLLAYFALYFVGGYLMYATLFTTIGAYCETPREAQTLLGPLMILLTIPFIFMVQAAVRPDTPQLQALSWFPPFTPFLMAARAAGGPAWWQVAGTASLMFAVTGLELWVAGRAFRTGALASGRFDIRVFLAGVTGRAERA
jgi:ABC-2 type transport system permease protein